MKTAAWMFPLVLCFSLALPAAVQADPDPGHGPMQGQGPQAHRCGQWMGDLSDDQQAQLARIKADHVKKQASLKARMKALKLELMAMALADSPDSGATDKKIDEMLQLKREILQNKVAKIGAERQVLNEQQRASYDVHVMKKSAREERGRGGHMRRGHGGEYGAGYGMGHGMGYGMGSGMGYGMGPGMGYGMGNGMGPGMGYGMHRGTER